MNLKTILVKYFLILVILQIIINLIQILKLNFILPIGNLSYSIIYVLIFIFLMNKLHQIESRFLTVILILLMYPILILFINFILGNIFIQFCNDVTDQSFDGILNLFENSCNFTTRFDLLQFIWDPYSAFNLIFFEGQFSFIGNLALSPYILYPSVFYVFILFKYFKLKKINPYQSFIPILNKLQILKICNLPLIWIFILLIPFIRLFWLYKINSKLNQIESINNSNTIWMTLFPSYFYGKLIFK